MNTSGQQISPPQEQLDKMLSVPSPTQWALLVAVLAFLGGALAWGLMGTINTTVSGEGILLRQEAVFDVVALGSGQVTELLVDLDDTVKEGQLVGRIRQLELENSIADTLSQLKTLRIEQKIISKFGTESHNKKAQYIEQRRATLQAAIKFSTERLKDISARTEHYKKMTDRGIVSRNEYLNSKHEYNQINKQIMEYSDLLSELSAENVDIASVKEKDAIHISMKVTDAKQRLESLRARLESTSRIISTRSGRVAELYKDRGEMIKTGAPLLRLDVADQSEDLFMVAYFSPYQGKMIKPGMPIHLTPSIVRVEEFGYIIGEVERVSLFSASRKGMLHTLDNAALVDRLSLGGAPLMVHVRMQKDPSTVSGYRWSSGQGPPLKLQAATLCSAQALIHAARPVDLVFPEIKRFFFGSPRRNTP